MAKSSPRSQVSSCVNILPASLQSVSRQVLTSFGCSESEATIVATHLVEANLAGHDSHGVGMLPMYGKEVANGALIPNQEPLLFEPAGAISIVDAQHGFGHRMALLALDHAMETVPKHKVGILAMRNSGHVSRLGTYSEYCAARGYVSMHMVNVTGHAPLVAPFGARETGFSTNPISIGIPGDDPGLSPFGNAHPLLDMATSNIAFGKVRVANNMGVAVPAGSLIDAEGLETTDPKPMAENRVGALQPFGGHKGSGLGVFVELLTGALAGNGTVADQNGRPDMVINTMLSIIIDPAAFDHPEAILQRVESYSDYVRALLPARDVKRVLMPGDPENITRAERHKTGIPVDDETIRQIVETGVSFGLNADQLRRNLNVL